MYPILVKFHLLGRETIVGTYGVLMVIAMATGILISIFLARREGYDGDDFLTYTLLIAAGIIGGAAIAGFIIFLPERIEYGFFEYPPAMVSWGGMVGGFTAALLVKIRWGQSLLNIADLCTPGSFIGLGIGRVGCHFGGCCFGVPTGLSIGITFTDPIAPASIMKGPLLPVQLISAAFLITAGLVFFYSALKRRTAGFLFYSALLVYAVFRFVIEYWRADPRGFLMGLSDGQIFSLFAFIAGTAGIIYSKKKRIDINFKKLKTPTSAE